MLRGNSTGEGNTNNGKDAVLDCMSPHRRPPEGSELSENAQEAVWEEVIPEERVGGMEALGHS